MLWLLAILLTNLFAKKLDQCASFETGKRRQFQGEIISKFDSNAGIRTAYHCQEMLQIRQLTISSQFFPPFYSNIDNQSK